MNTLPILMFLLIAILVLYPINKSSGYVMSVGIGLLFIISWLMVRFNEN
jgi:hypothetical protein